LREAQGVKKKGLKCSLLAPIAEGREFKVGGGGAKRGGTDEVLLQLSGERGTKELLLLHGSEKKTKKTNLGKTR